MGWKTASVMQMCASFGSLLPKVTEVGNSEWQERLSGFVGAGLQFLIIKDASLHPLHDQYSCWLSGSHREL